MYRKSFFIVLVSLLLMGILSTGSRMLSAIPGLSGLPSGYDPHVSVEEAAQSSKKPLLIEFYTDTCRTCQMVTPWVYNLGKKYEKDLTFVMVDVNDPKQGQIAGLFGIEYVPAIFVFDFHHMAKAQISTDSFSSKERLDKAIAKALIKVNKQAATKH